MKKLIFSALLALVLANSAFARSGDSGNGESQGSDWQQEQQIKQDLPGGGPEYKAAREAQRTGKYRDKDDAYVAAIKQVDKTKIGKEYNKIAGQNTRYAKQVEREYFADVRLKADTIWTNYQAKQAKQDRDTVKTYQTWRGESSDNQKSGATKNAGDQTGYNAVERDKVSM